jgi:hypothetical protein
MDVREAFERFNEAEFLRFDRIKNPPVRRPDLCAFTLIDKLVPDSGDIISGAEHDVIYLSVDIDDIEDTATEDDVLYLTRCGVLLNNEYDCLMMFV